MATAFLYDERFLGHDPGAGHPERRERLERTIGHLRSLDWYPELQQVAPRTAERQWLETTHAPSLIARAEAACRHLEVPLSPATVSRFTNDCLQVQLNANCREADVYVIQPLVPPVHEHLMELLQMLDAARGASASRTTAVIPYYGYARSDKKDAPRISIAGRLTADLLVTAGATRALTMTLHADQVHGFFSIPVDHLHALHILAEHFSDRERDNMVVVSPDLGRAKDAAHFGRLLDVAVAAGNKRRVSDQRVEIDTIVGDVRGDEQWAVTGVVGPFAADEMQSSSEPRVVIDQVLERRPRLIDLLVVESVAVAIAMRVNVPVPFTYAQSWDRIERRVAGIDLRHGQCPLQQEVAAQIEEVAVTLA